MNRLTFTREPSRFTATKHTGLGLLLAFGFSALCWVVMLHIGGVL